VGWQQIEKSRQPTQFVAVLQAGDDKPAFLLTVDTRTHNCIITAVNAPKKPDKSYEVWLVHEKLEKPKSLGVMAEGDMNVMPMANDPNAGLFMNATFAVSLEPEGGSPTGAPTGPVLFSGKLIKATP
jgi:anti-sigma-K factor RskA